MEQGYLAQVQALIDQKWKENPEEMKRVMEEIEAKEKEKPKVETPKRASFNPQLTQELIEEMSKVLHLIDMSKVQDLLERGADLEAKNEEGWTPLHLASYKDNIETTKLLIDAGADVEAKDNHGMTPLHWATNWNHIEIAKLLLDAGVDVEAKVNEELTLLDYAHNNEMRDLLQKYMKK
jgi:ankyrin repeat protein